jgi:DNA polymerase-3 subunit delta'
MIHPDVRFFYPASKNVTVTEIAERVQKLGEDPYLTVDFVRQPTSKAGNRQVIYPIAFIHDQVKPILDYKSFEGNYKVIVIMGAEALTEQTANAFLKMLEEPTERTVFILITERPDRLLQTILSRCQPVRFDRLSGEQIQEALSKRIGVSREDALSQAMLADGSLSVAMDLVDDEESMAFRREMLQFLRDIYSNQVPKVVERFENLSSMSLDQIKLFLSLLLGLVRDLILVRELGSKAAIVYVDDRADLVRFCKNLPDARLGQMVDLTEEAINLVSRNVRVQLVLMSLAAGLRRSMMGREALPLTTPLADQLITEVE